MRYNSLLVLGVLASASLVACTEPAPTNTYGDPDQGAKSPEDLGQARDMGQSTTADMRDAARDMIDSPPDLGADDAAPDLPDSTPEMALPRCGDGRIDEGERCDDGELNSDVTPNACRQSCQPASCGDAVLDDGEQCDEGASNSQGPDRCRLNCMTPYCGDGVKDAAEACDDGDQDDSNSCTTLCTTCGNGSVDAGESCDDAQLPGLDGDGCAASCQVEPLWACSVSAPSTCWPRWSPDSQAFAGTGYGSTIALYADYAFVGMPNESTQGAGAGAVYVYQKAQGKWTYVKRWLPPAQSDGARFGQAISATSAGILVGAPGQTSSRGLSQAGAVYHFELNAGQWTNFGTRYEAPTPRAQAGFGFSIAGGYIGAPGINDLSFAGAIYPFAMRGSAVQISSPLSAPGGHGGAAFGFSMVEVMGGGVVVGAPQLDSSAAPSPINGGGAVFLAQPPQLGGSHTISLLRAGSSRAQLGVALAWTGKHLLVGAPNADSGLGSVVLFDARLSNPITLVSPQRLRGSGFGTALAGVDDTIWLGAPTSSAVYKATFNQARWSFGTPLISPEPQLNDEYGRAIAAQGSEVLVGAPAFDLNQAPNAGAVFVQ